MIKIQLIALELMNLDSYSFRESILKVYIIFFWKMSKYLKTSLAAMTHLAEGLMF
jgi:hypothetical protein